MIIVKGAIPVKVTQREQALSLIEALAAASRVESGCIGYEVFVQASAPEVIVIWQQWASEEALEAHFDSDHVDAFLDAITDLVEGQVISERYDVVGVEYDDTAQECAELAQIEYADGIVLH